LRRSSQRAQNAPKVSFVWRTSPRSCRSVIRRRASSAALLLVKPRLLVNEPSLRLTAQRQRVPDAVS
jgi:hypothetical protein